MRVAYRTLAVERAFDFAGCDILGRYGIDPNEEEELAEEEDNDGEDAEDAEGVLDGTCTPKQLQRAYKK